MIDALHANSPNHHPMGLLGSAPSTAVAITPPFKCTDIDSAWLHLTATPSSLPESPSTPPLHFLGPHYLAALFLTSGFSQETLSRYFARPVSLDPDSECYLEGRAAWTTVLRALQGALAVLLWGEQPCSAGGDHHHLLAMAVTRKVTVDKAGLVRILAGVGRHRPASKAEEDEWTSLALAFIDPSPSALPTCWRLSSSDADDSAATTLPPAPPSQPAALGEHLVQLFHHAAERGATPLLRAVLARVAGGGGRTAGVAALLATDAHYALRYAAFYNHPAAVRALVAAYPAQLLPGALAARTHAALRRAWERGHRAVALVLLQAEVCGGGDVDGSETFIRDADLVELMGVRRPPPREDALVAWVQGKRALWEAEAAARASRRDATGGTELGFASDDEEDEMVLGEEDEGRE